MLFLEDFEPGQRFSSSEYEMTNSNIIEFASQFDPQYFHVDATEAKDSFFGDLAASGWHVGAVTMKLLTTTVPISNGIIGGGVDVRWVSPTRPGDVLHLEVRVEEVIPSRSKSDRGVVKVFVETVNQEGVVRQTLSSALLVFKRGATPKP